MNPLVRLGMAGLCALTTGCTGASQPTPDTAANDSGADSGELAIPFACDLKPGGSMGDCSECIDEKCSDLLPYCQTDEECSCMVECLRQEGVGAVDDCLARHGLPVRPTGFAQVEECVAFACPDQDECSTPTDWTPPDADLECDGTGTGGLAGGTEPDCAFDDTLGADPEGTTLQLQSTERDFCVRIERTSEGGGTLENTSWTLDDIYIGPLGGVAHVTNASDLCWYSSHHNFRDWTHVWTGTRHFDLVLKEDGHGGPRRYHVYAFEEGPLESGECAPTGDGERCIEGPLSLYPYEP